MLMKERLYRIRELSPQRAAFYNESEPAIQKELTISFDAENRRFDRIGLPRTQTLHCCSNFLDGSELCGFIAHNASLAHVFSTRFELRLYEHNDLPSATVVPRLRKSSRNDRWKNQRCGNERNIHRDKIHGHADSFMVLDSERWFFPRVGPAHPGAGRSPSGRSQCPLR